MDTYIVPSLNSLEHLKRLDLINRFTSENNQVKLLELQYKIKSEHDKIVNTNSVNANIKKEHLEIQLDLIAENLKSVKQKVVCPTQTSSPSTTYSSSTPSITPSTTYTPYKPTSPITINTIQYKDRNVYKDRDVYRDRVQYKDRDVYRDRIQYKDRNVYVNKATPELLEAIRTAEEAKYKKRLADEEKVRKERDSAAAELLSNELKKLARLQSELVNEAIRSEKKRKEEADKAFADYKAALDNKKKYDDEVSRKELNDSLLRKKKADAALLEQQRSLEAKLESERSKVAAYKEQVVKAEANRLAAERAAALKAEADRVAAAARESKIAIERASQERERILKVEKDAKEKIEKANRDLIDAKMLNDRMAIERATEAKNQAKRYAAEIESSKTLLAKEMREEKDLFLPFLCRSQRPTYSQWSQ
jgi:hypothetical protein